MSLDEKEFQEFCSIFVPEAGSVDAAMARKKFEDVHRTTFMAGINAERTRSKVLVEALQSVFDFLPGSQEGYACHFCDMGGAGESQFGDGFHDDWCPYWRIQKALEEYKGGEE